MPKDIFVTKIMDQVQTLDEIGGPESLQEYIAILQEVKTNIEARIDMAEQVLQDQEILMGSNE